ncbi:hypothetical protein AVEN_177441-1 [Araneus ventricosus]|uniref:Uncharacterized protein n=1 Tax=Araneus ventricosus TaxID=182803 RepID=A0A4Y2LBC0_ARAVE|nr:hypothetical protein AVEN_177441-1 [Araneus ventricosus]
MVISPVVILIAMCFQMWKTIHNKKPIKLNPLGPGWTSSHSWKLNFSYINVPFPLSVRQHEDYFRTSLAMVNHAQVTRATLELVLTIPSFRTTPTERRLANSYDVSCNRHHMADLLVESGILLHRSRDLTTRPPRLLL